MDPAFRYDDWRDGIITCIQYRVYPERPAIDAAYDTLEMHYYRSPLSNETIIAWMFPEARSSFDRHSGWGRKSSGCPALQGPNSIGSCRACRRGFGPASMAYTVREEGNLLYGGQPRPGIASDRVMVGGTAAGLVDATTGEGIYEAAMSGRYAAGGVASAGKREGRDPAPAYDRSTKHAFYARLRHRQKLMTFLERKPARFDGMLFRQLEATPRFSELLQHDRNDFTAGAVAVSVRASGALRIPRGVRLTG